MNYADAVDQLFKLPAELHDVDGSPRRKFDLAHMRCLLGELGHPQREFRSVLIAGTNGKGSTAAMLASIVGAAGYSVGLYTSPHLHRVNERIQFVQARGNILIDDAQLARLLTRVQEAGAKLVASGGLPWRPSFFETVTAVGMLAFAERAVDLAILEVGMGGRLDATNVVEPLFSVITDISLDHTEWLGSTVREIATEKAGVLRPGGVVVTLPQHPEANQAIGEVAVRLGVRGVNAADYMPFGTREAATGNDAGYSVSIFTKEVYIQPALEGQHQQRNAALAIAAAVELQGNHGFALNATHIAQGINQTQWPGRLERVHIPHGPDVILDVAHNAAGAWALRSALSERYAGISDSTLVFGCLEDKAVEEMGRILFPIFSRVSLTKVDSPRAASLGRLVKAAQSTGTSYEAFERPEEALDAGLRGAEKTRLLVVAGSIYLVGELRARLL